jgi:hypothetical protein
MGTQRHRVVGTSKSPMARSSLANLEPESKEYANKKDVSYCRRMIRQSIRGGPFLSIRLGVYVLTVLLFLYSLHQWIRSHHPSPHPRIVYWSDVNNGGSSSNGITITVSREDYHDALRPSEHKKSTTTTSGKKVIDPMLVVEDRRKSRDYRHDRADPLETEDCKVQYDWQKQTFCNCNSIHERIDWTHGTLLPVSNASSIALISNGYWRDVWVFGEEATWKTHVFKTQRFEHDFSERNFDRHRRDAVGKCETNILWRLSMCVTKNLSQQVSYLSALFFLWTWSLNAQLWNA